MKFSHVATALLLVTALVTVTNLLHLPHHAAPAGDKDAALRSEIDALAAAAKAGLVADTKLWGNELARHGIRTGAIAPGFVDTPILQGMRPEVLEKMLKAVPLRRSADPYEIFLAVKFIIECGFFTGRCIDVDGGQVI